jgi:4-hydroxybenzoate polyprenyltransferase
VRSYLELVRPPNLFTAAGDVLAGYVVVTLGANVDSRALLTLIAASVALYAAGVVLNDYFDRDLDKVERPERPIPSGRVRPGAALAFGLSLLIVGCLAAGLVGPAALAVGLALAAAILLYDARSKRIPFVGSLNMGACRFLNLLLGASGASATSGWLWLALPAACLVMIYIVGVTVLSGGEVWGSGKAIALGVLAATVGVCCGVVVLGITGGLPHLALIPFLAAFALATLPAVARVVSDPTAMNVRRAIKISILSLPLLDASLAAGAAGWPWGLLVAALIVPSVLVAKLFAVT